MAEFQQISTHEDGPVPTEGTPEHEQAMIQLAEEAGSVARGCGAIMSDRKKKTRMV